MTGVARGANGLRRPSSILGRDAAIGLNSGTPTASEA